MQRAVSGCLPPLMGGLAADAEYVAALVQRLLGMLSADRYGDRCDAQLLLALKAVSCTALHVVASQLPDISDRSGGCQTSESIPSSA